MAERVDCGAYCPNSVWRQICDDPLVGDRLRLAGIRDIAVSSTQVELLAYMQQHGPRLRRFDGGHWRSRRALRAGDWRAFPSSTVQALARKGVLHIVRVPEHLRKTEMIELLVDISDSAQQQLMRASQKRKHAGESDASVPAIAGQLLNAVAARPELIKSLLGGESEAIAPPPSEPEVAPEAQQSLALDGGQSAIMQYIRAVETEMVELREQVARNSIRHFAGLGNLPTLTKGEIATTAQVTLGRQFREPSDFGSAEELKRVDREWRLFAVSKRDAARQVTTEGVSE